MGTGYHRAESMPPATPFPPLRLGYKASAEQFAPAPLLSFGVAAERLGLDSVAVSDHFQPFRHDGGHSPASLPWLGALAASTSRVLVGTERAHAHLPLPPGGRRAGLRHARLPRARPHLPRPGLRRGDERGRADRRRMAGRGRAARAAARGRRPDPPALDGRAGALRRPLVQDRRRGHLRPAAGADPRLDRSRRTEGRALRRRRGRPDHDVGQAARALLRAAAAERRGGRDRGRRRPRRRSSA